MTNVNETVVRYIAALNERDPKRPPRTRRRDLEPRTAATSMPIATARVTAPSTHAGDDAGAIPGYRLNLVSGIETHNNFVRFSWAAGGSNEAPLYLGGTDFATLAPGRPHQCRGRFHRRRSGTDEITAGGHHQQGGAGAHGCGSAAIRAGVRNTPLSWSRARNAG